MAELIGQAQSDPVLAATLRAGWLLPRREARPPVLTRAVDRGQLRAGLDIPTVMDQLYAPVYWRLMMRHEPLPARLADTLVGLAARRRPPSAVRHVRPGHPPPAVTVVRAIWSARSDGVSCSDRSRSNRAGSATR